MEDKEITIPTKRLYELLEFETKNKDLKVDIVKKTVELRHHEKTYQWLRKENQRLKKWVNDLQAGMYINCVYCGHRFGVDGEVPSSMAGVLKKHIEKCPAHPMSKLKDENKQLRAALEPAKRTIILLHCNYENTRAPHDGNVPGCEICANLKIIEQLLKS